MKVTSYQYELSSEGKAIIKKGSRQISPDLLKMYKGQILDKKEVGLSR